MTSPVRLSTWCRRFSRHRTRTACTVDAGMPSFAPIATGPSRCFHRRCTTLRTSCCGVRFATRCGREDRSVMPAWPIAAYRSAQRFAVGQEQLNCSAARDTGHPWSMTRRATRNRWRGVKAALAWDMRTSWSPQRLSKQLHCATGGPHPSVNDSSESSHSPNQRPWAVHLEPRIRLWTGMTDYPSRNGDGRRPRSRTPPCRGRFWNSPRSTGRASR